MGARRLRRDGRIVSILPGPAVDCPTTVALEKYLLALVGWNPAAEILVDFRHVRSLDSDALGPLLTLHRELPLAGVRLILCGLDDAVFEVFEAVKLDRVFRFEAAPPTESE